MTAVDENEQSKPAETEAKQSVGDAKKKKLEGPPTKVVLRRLPPMMTEEQLKLQLDPLPLLNYFAFVPADMSLAPWAYSRAYMNFENVDDIVQFRDRFDGYVFVDAKGNESQAMVELAPFPKVPIKSKKDPKCGTIENDPDYKNFLESLQNPEPVQLPTMESYLQEIEKRNKELKEMARKKTPLLEYLEKKRLEKIRKREEKKKQREEERRQWLEAQERERRERERRRKEKLAAAKRAEVGPRFAKEKEKSVDKSQAEKREKVANKAKESDSSGKNETKSEAETKSETKTSSAATKSSSATSRKEPKRREEYEVPPRMATKVSSSSTKTSSSSTKTSNSSAKTSNSSSAHRYEDGQYYYEYDDGSYYEYDSRGGGYDGYDKTRYEAGGYANNDYSSGSGSGYGSKSRPLKSSTTSARGEKAQDAGKPVSTEKSRGFRARERPERPIYQPGRRRAEQN